LKRREEEKKIRRDKFYYGSVFTPSLLKKGFEKV